MYVLQYITIRLKQKYGHKTSRSAGMNLRCNSGFTANQVSVFSIEVCVSMLVDVIHMNILQITPKYHEIKIFK